MLSPSFLTRVGRRLRPKLPGLGFRNVGLVKTNWGFQMYPLKIAAIPIKLPIINGNPINVAPVNDSIAPHIYVLTDDEILSRIPSELADKTEYVLPLMRIIEGMTLSRSKQLERLKAMSYPPKQPGITYRFTVSPQQEIKTKA